MRTCKMTRKTAETDICLELNLRMTRVIGVGCLRVLKAAQYLMSI